MPQNIYLPNETATCALAATLAAQVSPPMTLCLDGPLGAGKSVFARAFLTALGVTGDIPSPTFTLVQTYEVQEQEIWHMDAYRIDDPGEAEELGILEAFSTALCLIEWPGKIAQLLPERRIDLFLQRVDGEDGARQVTIDTPHNEALTLS